MNKLFYLVIIFFFLVPFTSFSYDLYFVNGDSVGVNPLYNGNYNNPYHWDTVSGGPGLVIIPGFPDDTLVPKSTDNVYFDANSGLGTGKTVYINSSSVCHDFMWNGGSGTAIAGTGTLDVYGSFMLAPLQNTWSWFGDLNFYSGGSESIIVRGNVFFNWNIEFKPFGGDFTVMDKWTQRFYIGGGWGLVAKTIFNTNGGSVTFNDDYQAGARADIQNNTNVLVLGDFTTGNPNETSYPDYYQQAINQYDGTNMVVQGNTNIHQYRLEGGVLKLKGDTSSFSIVYYHGGNAADTLDMRNNIVNIRRFWRCNNGLHSLLTDNSTLNGIYGTTTFVGGSKTYNVVNFYKYADINTLPATFDSLTFYSGCNTTIDINIGVPASNSLLKLNISPAIYDFRSNRNVNIASNVLTDIVGTCDSNIFLRNAKFNFSTPAGTGAQHLMDYVRMEGNNALGVDAPYSAGTNSYEVVGTTNPGWLFTAPTPRYLRWIGPIPTNIATDSLYGVWDNPNNWSNNPTASPSNPIGGPQCPPKFVDSVVFPDSSYVNLEGAISECKHMTWEQEGNIIGQEIKELEIWGSLYFSPEMTNGFMGTVLFRAWEKGQTITVNTKQFNYKVDFKASADTGQWFLLDSFSAPVDVLAGPTIDLWRGDLHTNGNPILTRQFRSEGSGKRTLNLYNSIVEVTGYYKNYGADDGSRPHYAWEATTKASGLTINAGTSHIYFTYPANAAQTLYWRMYPGTDQKYNNVTFQNGEKAYVFPANDTFNVLTFERSGRMNYTGVNSFIKTLQTNTIDKSAAFDFGDGNVGRNVQIDTGYFHGGVNFNSLGNYNHKMKLFPGGTYNIGVNGTQTLNAANVLDAQASCTDNIFINNGVLASTFYQWGDYLLINNNSAVGNTFDAFNSQAIGTVSGWNVPPSVGRKLYWIDTITNASMKQWNDRSSWSLADGYMLDQTAGNDFNIGNCPPTPLDTVIFTNNSFTGNDTVNIDLGSTSATCFSMDWSQTTTVNPVFYTTNPSTSPGDPAVGQWLEIYGSLTFSSAMNHQFTGNVKFRGVGTDNTITSAGKSFKRWLYFQGDSDSTAWHLQDSLAAPWNPSIRTIVLSRGHLHTDGHPLLTYQFFSRTPSVRSLNLYNSNMYITGKFYRPLWTVYHYAWETHSTSNLTINSGTSNIYFTSTNQNMFLGNNHTMHNVDFLNYGGNIRSIQNDTFNVVTYISTGNFGMGLVDSNNVAQKIEFIADAGTISSHKLIADSIVFHRNGTINFSSYINKLLRFEPGMTYTLGSNYVQHIANAGEFDLLGSPGNQITLRSTVSGVETFIRKDSGRICADYIFIRDQWAIGNGFSPQQDTSIVPAVYNNPYLDTSLVSSGNPLDTSFVTRHNPLGYEINYENDYQLRDSSGRALFQGGAYADDQGNNAGWSFAPYPPYPDASIVNINDTICENDSVQLVFELIGEAPFNVQYSANTVDTSIFIDSVNVNITSGQGTSIDPFIWSFYVNPTQTTKYIIEEIQTERCFNSIAFGPLDSVEVLIDSLPYNIVGFAAPDTVCPMSTTVITATANNGFIFEVYDNLTGGTLLDSTSYTTAPLASTDTFYIEAISPYRGCRSTSRESMIIPVMDITPPVVICNDTTVYLDASGQVIIDTSFIFTSATDNCAMDSVWSNDTLFTCVNVGLNTAKIYALDVNGNIDSCIANVTVMDTINPVVVCNDTTIYLNALGQYSIDTSYVFSNASDNCGVDSVWINTSDALFTCADTGVNTVTVYVRDNNANMDSCTANVTVMDTVNPVVVCNDTTIYLNALGQYSIDTSYVFSNASDNCGIDSIWISTTDTLYTCSAIGINTVTVYVRDNNGNMDSCTANVTVMDTVNPLVVCNDTTIYLNALGQYSIDTSYVFSNASDNCGIDSIWISTTDTLYTCSTIGVNTVTVYARDNNGNIDSCIANVTVMDTVNPVVVCNDTTIYLDALGQYSIDTSYVFTSASDNCGVDSVWINTTDALFTCTDTGVNTIAVYVRDANNNIDSCMANVRVLDTLNPIITCQDTTIYLNASGSYTIDTSYVFASASDNCGLDSIWINTTNTLYSCTDTGLNSVTVYVRDNNGNIDSCTANVTVMDTINPIVVCNDTTIYLDGSGQYVIDTSYVFKSASDNCGVDSIWINTIDTLYTCSTIGVNAVTVYARENNGNIDSCIANVTVMDTINPVVVCNDTTIYLNALGQYSIDTSYVFSNASDNCGVDSVWINTSDALFTCADTGVNTVIVYARDNNGNIDSCTANVTVMDTVNPVVVCNDTTIYLDALGQYSIDTSYVFSNASDNCGVDSIWISTADTLYTCSTIGVNTVTVYVRDNNGNMDSCTANVTVMDTISPTIVCQSATIYLGANGQANIDTTGLVNSVSDNCSVDSVWVNVNDTLITCLNLGNYTATIYVMDNSGNLDSCLSNLTVIDTVIPTVICNDTTIYLNASGTYTIDTSYVYSNSSDNCSVDSVWITNSSFNCSDTGLNTVTVYVADNSGNIDSCTANVMVLDTVNPTINCKNAIVYLDTNGQFIIDTSYVYSSAFAGCGLDSIWIADSIFDCSRIGVNTISVYAKDINGNIDSCQAQVTVMDSVNPQITCGSTLYDTVTNACEYIVPDFRLSTQPTDNCTDSISFQIAQTPAPGTVITIQDQQTESIVITVTDTNGNQTVCMFDVEITCNDEFQIPEFISPNGDGKNDTWIITGIEAYPNNNVKVFNRYGAMVYHTNGYHNQWDGTANVDYIFQSGESDGILPSGTYYFILELDVNAKEKEVFKGIIQIHK